MRLKHNIEVTHEESFIRRYVDIFSAMGIAEDSWLSSREKDFFVRSVTLYNSGVDLASRDAVRILSDELNFKESSRGVYIYRNKLKKKGWITQTTAGIKIPPAFDFRGKNVKDINFEIGLKWTLSNDSSKQKSFSSEKM